MNTPLNRRKLLARGLQAAGILALDPMLKGCRQTGAAGSQMLNLLSPRFHQLGPLLEADENGVMLPEGFTSRIIARSGAPISESITFAWHDTPDGGAVFAKDDGGWLYVSNSESDDGEGGSSVIAFDMDGELIDAYSILDGTSKNCAGGVTPWGTWLSCEEFDDGQVWECDPHGKSQARLLSELGVFSHEAAAVDPATGIIYLTEDQSNGLLYRYVPASYSPGTVPDFTGGTLQALRINDDDFGNLDWIDVPDPSAASGSTRSQLDDAAEFAGGEGIWFHDDKVYFSTKFDNRIWVLDIGAEELSILYDAADESDVLLSGVDNLTVTPTGHVVVAEDLASDAFDFGGDPQIVAIDPSGNPSVLLQLEGHSLSEITGPAFNPNGDRLYFSSQRGTEGFGSDGMTFEISGPFFAKL